MRIEDFKKFVEKGSKVIKGNMTFPVTNYILFENKKAIVTNLDIYIFIETDIEDSFTIDFKDFKLMVSKVKSGEVSFEKEDKKVKVKTEKGVFTFTQTDDDFPDMVIPEELVYKFSKEDAENIIKTSEYCVNDDLRPVMEGVFFEENNVVATDANMLKYHEIKTKIDKSFIIHKDAIKLFEKEAMELYVTGNKFMFKFDKYSLITREIDGIFPKWKAVIPQDPISKLNISGKTLKELIDITSIVVNKKNVLNCPLQFKISNNKLNLYVEDIDYGKSFKKTIDVDYEGDDIVIGLRSTFLDKIIKTEKQDNYSIKFHGATRGLIINENLLLMPVMIKNPHFV